MLVSAGSISTQATSPSASSRSRPSRSLISTTRVVSSTGTGGPTLPYTGVDAWIPGVSGALLLGGGLALRRRLRD